ncbi:DUF1540 domain-containing protein [Romboutsia sedimentorum]|uniref:DUF1540 domain-containing protein n=1 Tax=Romboutsia sedimentorum TaxID=1368474 RepID=A0ABT7E728_9FIRM|nr:DUF1540 domain-containing protein [Romboutsia sedimentorum]MDK2562734.1 DUF1540 domain-containing protein [Romboutsia sedimentorum]MDK2585783.1 DUF1540 domain-containing protein [Romboutsia sedimentorum]
MSNGNLSCSATNCVHNNASSCYAGAISVAGTQATTTGSTTCASFEDRSSSSMSNCGSEGCTCTKTGSIACQATKCSYNNSGSCKASSVQINAQNASCETFICK